MVDIPPDERVEETEFFPDCQDAPGISNGRFNLQASAHNAGVRKQALNIRRGIARHLMQIKSMESSAIVASLPENGQPAQTCLRSLENQQLEKTAIFM
jgi:ribosomal protein S9